MTREDVLREVSAPQHRTTLINNIVHRGRSLLQHAARSGDFDVCRVLLHYGAAADCDPDRPPAPDLPVSGGGDGVDPTGGGAPLHYAAASLAAAPFSANARTGAERLLTTVNVLLEAGADPFRENAAGLTALDLMLGEGGASVGRGGNVASMRGAGACFGRLVAALGGQRPRRRDAAQEAAVRRMLVAGLLAGGAAMLQVPPFGPNDWECVWLAVVPRRGRGAAAEARSAGFSARAAAGGAGASTVSYELLCFALGEGLAAAAPTPAQAARDAAGGVPGGLGPLRLRLPLRRCNVESLEDGSARLLVQAPGRPADLTRPFVEPTLPAPSAAESGILFPRNAKQSHRRRLPRTRPNCGA
ncbi:hypothetical protein GPECTOR_39g404 [Gonium pectorale]|uniref:Uncharacterized protein n=1 Tax=Gonium pectorale TaxID=33097 RepID=A0A150GC23_GONPE|nr:hypothetical protein GPECTOR_39g404 [Gonium pectorale]|eukprot:KXZ46910.1 hypothetical protein GPECTOR_39g404 [Gonium pectorale]